MIVCGVELKANEAIICLLTYSNGLYSLPDCRASRLSLQGNSTEAMRAFQNTFAKLMEDYKVSTVAIRERQQKGKFAGGAIGFKLEAAIQLIKPLDVDVIAPSAIKAAISHSPIPVHFADTGLKAFQETAFVTAYAHWVALNKMD